MIRINLEIIDRGRVIARPEIVDDNIDGALFDFQEAKARLAPGQWINIPDYWSLPAEHRVAFS